jgi:outer membrane protein TolC
MKIIQIIAFIIFGHTCVAQNTLSEVEFIQIIKQFHPIVKQANINVDIAKAEVLSARGGFDPKLSAENRAKVFTGDNYYDQTTTQLVIPTWYGIDVYAGTETLAGSKTDPEATKGNVSFVGVNIPLVQNLLYDKRRATLQKAKLMVNFSDEQRRAEVNDLLREALHEYWNWWQQHHSYLLADTVLKNAQTRFNMIKTAFRLGDRAAIDTIEALTQIQTFELEKNDAYLKLMKARLSVSAFLWDRNNDAYELPVNIIPANMQTGILPALDSLLVSVEAHPNLLQYNFKLSALQIEKRLRFQSLLPEIDLKYQQLGSNYNFSKTVVSPWLQNNYRFGISFAMPLRLSEARGEFKQAKLNVDRTVFERADKRNQMQNKLKQSYMEWLQLNIQLQQQSSLVYNYQQLQKAEEIRFFNGESSLFLINAREIKTLESKQKQIALQTKNRKSQVDVKWSAGIGF